LKGGDRADAVVRLNGAVEVSVEEIAGWVDGPTTAEKLCKTSGV
jgi:hypothetical protein